MARRPAYHSLACWLLAYLGLAVATVAMIITVTRQT